MQPQFLGWSKETPTKIPKVSQVIPTKGHPECLSGSDGPCANTKAPSVEPEAAYRGNNSSVSAGKKTQNVSMEECSVGKAPSICQG